jgi:DNA polymerase-3 subunit epsilon
MIVAGLDTETTSKLHPDHRIIELCVQKWDFDPDTGKAAKLNEKTWRIHPGRSIDPKAYAVHKISLDDLAGSPPLEACADEIIDYMHGVDWFVAHNGNEFDRPFIRMEYERVNASHLPALDRQRWFDTMEEGRWAHPWGKVPNLRELCWASDVHYDPALSHRADYDVEVMMRSFFFGVRAGFFTLRSPGAALAA